MRDLVICTQNQILTGVIKFSTMGWSGHVACIREMNMMIKIDFEEMWFGDGDGIHLAPGRNE